jgi:hypothetical protein
MQTNSTQKKLYEVFVMFDNGRQDEFEIYADSLDEAYDKVYEDIGFDPGCVDIYEVENDCL